MPRQHTNTRKLYQLCAGALKFMRWRNRVNCCKLLNVLAPPWNGSVAESAPESSTSIAGDRSQATQVSRALVVFLASGALVGYTPVIPGTAGSLLGLLLVRTAISSIWQRSPITFLLLFGVAFVVASRVADRAERIFGEADSPAIVIDEVLGMIATMFGNPVSWPWLIAGFTLFRLFDIIKPWPASRFDHMRGGAGVMLDDLAAAFYANLTLRTLRLLT
jgi:phosphatidylglycerophosphatase A